MRVSNVLFAVVIVILALSLVSIWFYPSVRDFMASNSMWNGIRNFSSESGTKNIESLEELPRAPQRTVLLLIPYVQFSDEELSDVKRFASDGGTLLLMDDYGYGNDILAYLGLPVRFDGRPLLDPLFSFKNPRMPRITDFKPEIKNSGINSVTLNHATVLTDVEESQLLAWSSADSFLDSNRDESRSLDEPNGPFPIAARLPFGQGRVVIVSDPSVMINSMVGRDDNYRFMQYLLALLDASKPCTILLDRSHLTKAPLDVSKTRLTNAREVLSSPYALLGVVAIIFVAVSRYSLKKGEPVD